MKLKTLLLNIFLLCQIQLISQTQIGMDILGEQGDGCGSAVSFSEDGNRLAVGYFWSNNETGAVRIFDNINGEWEQVGSTLVGNFFDSFFGGTLSLSDDGKRVVIGAFKDTENGALSGKVKVYELVNGDWNQLGNTIYGEYSGDEFGFSVAISADGTRIAASSQNSNHTVSGLTTYGHVRVFDLINGNWTQAGGSIYGTILSAEFAWSIALSGDGNRLAVGSHYGNQVKVFDFQNNDWVQVGNDLNGQSVGDQFGFRISLSSDGQYLAIGAKGNDNNGLGSGQVLVYKFLTGNWVLHGNEILGDQSDELGWSVSISDDGSKVAASSLRLNSSNIGYVKIFELLDNSWEQMDSTIHASSPGDFFGWTVQLSPSGDYLAIGAPNQDDVVFNGGLVRVFELAGPNLISTDDCFTLKHPTNNNRFILSGDFTNCNIFVLDENENVVQFLLNIFDKITIDINELPAGLHFVRVEHQVYPDLSIQHIIKDP